MTEYAKIGGTEIMKLKPGDWVAWRQERWEAIGASTKWMEAQLAEHSVRCHQVVFVRLGGARISVEKNRLYKPAVVVRIDVMHETGNYDS